MQVSKVFFPPRYYLPCPLSLLAICILTIRRRGRRSFHAPNNPKAPTSSMKTPVAMTPPNIAKLDTYEPPLAQAATAMIIMPQVYVI